MIQVAMRIIECNNEQHALPILAIFNEVILNSTALYEYQPRTAASIAAWFAAKQAGQYPVLGIEVASGELLAFASYGKFRNFPAYQYSVEHSVYVRHDQRGQGLGKQLMRVLIARAIEQQYHLMVGAIDASNLTSVALHQQLGFTHAGTIKQAGFKFDRWLDVAFYQLILDTPRYPMGA
jgi:phosphinothricin acetyltransferase